MDEIRSRRMCERLAHARLDADSVDLAHREHLRVEPAEQLALAGVERADADERDATGLHRRQRPARRARTTDRRDRARRRAPFRAHSRSATTPACSGRRARRSRRHRPDRARTPSRRACRARSNGRRRARAAPHPSRARRATSLATPSHSSRICDRNRALSSPTAVDSGIGACTSPSVLDGDAELLGEMLPKPRVPDRRRAHVDAATILSEIERRADHDDRRDRVVACSRQQG